jgi:hypothetical protein
MVAHTILRRKLALLWAQGLVPGDAQSAAVARAGAIKLGSKLADAGVAPVNLSRLGELFPDGH